MLKAKDVLGKGPAFSIILGLACLYKMCGLRKFFLSLRSLDFLENFNGGLLLGVRALGQSLEKDNSPSNFLEPVTVGKQKAKDNGFLLKLKTTGDT